MITANQARENNKESVASATKLESVRINGLIDKASKNPIPTNFIVTDSYLRDVNRKALIDSGYELTNVQVEGGEKAIKVSW